jgi:hypothetical protein
MVWKASMHHSVRRSVQVPHPNLLIFRSHLQDAASDNVADVHRLQKNLRIRRPKKKTSLKNDKLVRDCTARRQWPLLKN